jgi:hypothetical protein
VADQNLPRRVHRRILPLTDHVGGAWLLALGGLRLGRLRGTLGLAPCWPADWGDRLRALPVFQPGLRGEVEASRGAKGWEVDFTVKRLLSPLTLKEVSAWLPGRVPGKDFDPAWARVEVEGLDPAAVAVLPSGRVSIAKPVRLEKEGDGFHIAFLYG